MSDAGQGKKQIPLGLKADLSHFVLSELNIGLQFAELALDSYRRNLGADGDRQKDGAIHALQTARQFHPQLDPDDSQRDLVERRIVELTTALSKIDILQP
jgi:hypothetical protein